MKENCSVAINRIIHWEMKKLAAERDVTVRELYVEAIKRYLMYVKVQNRNKEDV